jgi:MurNAc alpha-1-phosphate uridylyltransferase
MVAMILAAGRGERLKPITDATPKALVEVGGISLLEQQLGEQIAERIGSGQQYGLQVVYSPEYDNILDTGGGIMRALPLPWQCTVLGHQCRYPY